MQEHSRECCEFGCRTVYINMHTHSQMICQNNESRVVSRAHHARTHYARTPKPARHSLARAMRTLTHLIENGLNDAFVYERVCEHIHVCVGVCKQNL